MLGVDNGFYKPDDASFRFHPEAMTMPTLSFIGSAFAPHQCKREKLERDFFNIANVAFLQRLFKVVALPPTFFKALSNYKISALQLGA